MLLQPGEGQCRGGRGVGVIALPFQDPKLENSSVSLTGPLPPLQALLSQPVRGSKDNVSLFWHLYLPLHSV
jgi:hypothetical protein